MALKKTALLSLLLALVVCAGVSIWKGLPPFDSLHKPAEHSEKEEVKSFPEKPPFRFSSRSLSRLCDDYGLDKAGILQGLERLGINVEPEWSIKRIAEANDMEPHSVFDTIRQLQE